MSALPDSVIKVSAAPTVYRLAGEITKHNCYVNYNQHKVSTCRKQIWHLTQHIRFANTG